MATTESSRPAARRCGPARPGNLSRIRSPESRATSSLITEMAKTSHAIQPDGGDQPDQDGSVVPGQQGIAHPVPGDGGGQRVASQPDQGSGDSHQAEQQQCERAEAAEHAEQGGHQPASGKKILSMAATRKIRLKISAGSVM